MLNTNVGIEWGLDMEVNNNGDLSLMLKVLKLDDNDQVLFQKTINHAILQYVVQEADSLTQQQKTLIINALNNFRNQLLGTL